jgi:glutamate dehydrogenase
MTDQERSRASVRAEHFKEKGAPEDLARDVAVLPTMVAALDVADLAERTGWPAPTVARVFRWVGAAFGLDRLRGAANAFVLEQHWDRLALRRTLEELYEDQRLLASAALRSAKTAPAGLSRDQAAALAQSWIDAEGGRAMRALETVAELEFSGGWTFTKTILAAAEIRSLAAMASAA